MKVGGENPNKINNIVNAQLLYLRALYKPILPSISNLKCMPVSFSENNRPLMFSQESDIKSRAVMFTSLPKKLKDRIIIEFQNDPSSHTKGLGRCPNFYLYIEFIYFVIAL